MDTSFIQTIISCAAVLVSLCAVIISAASVRASKTTPMNSTYYEMVSKAYADYLSAIDKFVLHRGIQEKDLLIDRLHQVQLLGSERIRGLATMHCDHLLLWAQDNPREFYLDNEVQDLILEFASDLVSLCENGRRIKARR